MRLFCAIVLIFGLALPAEAEDRRATSSPCLTQVLPA
jgi:hypothetical protein